MRDLAALEVVRAGKYELCCCTSADGGIEGSDPVGAHDDEYTERLVGDLADAADQRVDAGAVLVVHLRRFNGTVPIASRFVDEQNDRPAAPDGARLTNPLRRTRCRSTGSSLRRRPAAPGPQAKPLDPYVDIVLARNRIGECFG